MSAGRAGPTLTPPTCGGLSAESASRSRRASRSSRSAGREPHHRRSLFRIAGERADHKLPIARHRDELRTGRSPQRLLVGAEMTDDGWRALHWASS